MAPTGLDMRAHTATGRRAVLSERAELRSHFKAVTVYKGVGFECRSV